MLLGTAVATITVAAIGAPALAGDGLDTRRVAAWTKRIKSTTREEARPASAKARNKAYAARLVARRSWSDTQFECLDSLWTRESNWNHRARNARSGAYGIPQALPGSKMRSAARDWRVNPKTQIKWGLRYIESRYGSPCDAWSHFQAHNWY